MAEEISRQPAGRDLGDSGEKPLSVEESFRLLEEMAGRMENPDTTLEESFQLYQKGMQLLKGVNETLDMFEKKMQILSAGEEAAEDDLPAGEAVFDDIIDGELPFM